MPAPSRNEIYEAVIRKMVAQALEEQEDAFARDHEQDADAELLACLRAAARQLGYSPRYKEIVGWRTIEMRFGSWSEALQKAGLPPAARCPVTKLPRVQEETQRQKERYRQRKAEKKQKNRRRLEEQARKQKEYANTTANE